MEVFKKKDVNIETRYTIEYLDNEKDLDYVNSGRIDKGEPWERYKTKQFDNIESALSIYMLWFVNDKILDIKLFEEIVLDGETIRETYIEPDSTTAYSLKNIINKLMYDENKHYSQQAETLKKENDLYKKFVKLYNSEQTFNGFVKQLSNAKVYRYYSLERPVMPGSYPKRANVENIENYDKKVLSDDIGRLVWGYIEYNEPLTRKDCYDYELEPSREAWKETVA